MAIERPKASDDAPACGPQQREGRQAGEFLVSRGMGAAQGKKLARRRCGIGDRGAAGLRPDQAIEEATWERRDQTATKQEHWRPSFTGRNSAHPTKQPRVHSRSAPSPKPTSRTPRDPTQDHGNPLASRRRRRLFQPERRPRPSLGVARTIHQHPIVDQARSRPTAFTMLAHGRWKPSRRMLPRAMPSPADRAEPAGRQSRWRRRR